MWAGYAGTMVLMSPSWGSFKFASIRSCFLKRFG
jgi:hypothetical protein